MLVREHWGSVLVYAFAQHKRTTSCDSRTVFMFMLWSVVLRIPEGVLRGERGLLPLEGKRSQCKRAA